MKLTDQQAKDLEWVKAHKQHIENRNKALKYLGLILVWLGVSIGNYYLLNAATLTGLANGIIAFGFEVGLAIGIILGYLKVCNKKIKTYDILVSALAYAFATMVTDGSISRAPGARQ